MTSLDERFWSLVVKSDACWEWTGTILDSGYGQLWAWGKKQRAHRVSWQLANGPVNDNSLVLHRCDNRRCVRPDHLYLGSHRNNMQDRSDRGRAHRPVGVGHPSARLTDADVRAIRSRFGRGETQRFLVKAYGVGQSTISMVVTRKHWGHVV